jgi:hypothetical protein
MHSSLLAALQMFFGAVGLMDYLDVGYYSTANRVTNYESFGLSFKLTIPLVLLLAASIWFRRKKPVEPLFFISIPWVVDVTGFDNIALALSASLNLLMGLRSILELDYVSWVIKVKSDPLYGILTVYASLSGLGLLHWIAFAPFGVTILESVARDFMNLNSLGGYVAPILVFPLLFTWILRPLLGRRLSSDLVYLDVEGEENGRWMILAVVSVLIGVSGALYPYLYNINPGGLCDGIDFDAYVQALEGINRGTSTIFTAHDGSRPLVFLVLRVFQMAFGLSEHGAVRYMPLLLNPLIVVSTMVLAQEVFHDREITAWAGFAASTGYWVTAGTYAYFLSNNMGVMFTSLSFAYLFRALEHEDVVGLVISTFLGVLVSYTHHWSLLQLVGPLMLYLALLYIKPFEQQRHVKKYLLLYAVAVSLNELVKYVLSRGTGGYPSTYDFLYASFAPLKLVNTIYMVFQRLYSGYLSNIVIMSFSLIGLFYMDLKKLPSRYYYLLTASSSMVFLLFDEEIKSRLLYNLPLPLFTSYGFYIIKSKAERPFILYFFFAASLLLYLYQCLANTVSLR